MTKHMSRRSQQGFTLIELMVVVLIVSILVGIGLPSYRNSVVRANRADAQAALLGFAQAMERRYQERYNYRAAAAGASDTGIPDPTVYPAQAPLEGEAFYNLTIETPQSPVTFDTGYRLRATPIAGGPQDGDGIIELDSLGRRGWDADNSGTIDAGEFTWQR